MTKLTFEEALERIGDEHRVDSKDVQAQALRRKVWVAEWHMPGCLPEGRSVCLTKKDAIAEACLMAETSKGAPRGMKTALAKYGRFDSTSLMFGTCINTVSSHSLADIL